MSPSFKQIGLLFVLITLATIHWGLGGDMLMGFVLIAAVYLGWQACVTVGALQTAHGLLIFSLLLKYLVIGVVCKLLVLESWDQKLASPLSTALVMFFGFGGMWGAAYFAMKLFPRDMSMEVYKCSHRDNLIIGYSIAFVAGIAKLASVNYTSGRGLILPFANLFPAALAHFIFYGFESRNPTRWLHAVLLSVAMLAIGVVSAGKEEMFLPLLVFAICFFMKYRLRPKVLMGVGLICFVCGSMLYPYAQYMKGSLRGQNSFQHLTEFVTDSSMRRISRENSFAIMEAQDMNYVGVDVGLLERFMLIKPMDRLVAATDSNGYTGWSTIVSAIENLIPRQLLRNKADQNVNNQFAQLTGVLDSSDQNTSVSFTMFGNFYNAFGFSGVFFGIACFSLLLLGLLHSILKGHESFGPWTAALVAVSQHNIAEGSLGDAIFMLIVMTAYGLLLKGGEMLGWWGKKVPREQPWKVETGPGNTIGGARPRRVRAN